MFFKNDDMLAFFSLMNDIEMGIAPVSSLVTAPTKQKLQFLAIIEEVSLYAEQYEVDKSYARYLFQWHFFYVYLSKKTAAAFWENLGGEEEMNASYWSKSRNLSAFFTPEGSE